MLKELLVQPVYAAGANKTSFVVSSISGFNDLSNILAFILNVATGLGLFASALAFIGAGITYGFSQGDPKAGDKARTWATFGVLALVATLAAATMRVVVKNTLGASGDISVSNVTF